ALPGGCAEFRPRRAMPHPRSSPFPPSLESDCRLQPIPASVRIHANQNREHPGQLKPVLSHNPTRLFLPPFRKLPPAISVFPCRPAGNFLKRLSDPLFCVPPGLCPDTTPFGPRKYDAPAGDTVRGLTSERAAFSHTRSPSADLSSSPQNRLRSHA